MKISIIILFLLGGIASHSLTAQEVRVQGNALILGYINDPFIGAGVGFEAGTGNHIAISADGNWGSQKRGSSIELRPAVNYYFGTGQTGLFAGVAFKYISLNEKNKGDTPWEDNLYSIGFNLGYKVVMKERWALTLVASPHKTIGGHKEGDVAGMSMQLALGYRL